jgi:DNA-binding FadR family transcriptional regulator
MADTPLLPVSDEAHARIYWPIRARRAAPARRAMHEHLSTTIHHHSGLTDWKTQ